MKIAGIAGELAAATKVAASAVDEKTAKRLPILGALLIDASADIIKFTGTDLDMATMVQTAGTIKEPGRSAVSAEALSKLLAGIAGDHDVTIETIDAGIRIQAGRSRYRLPALKPEDFPQPPATSATADLVLSSEQVQRLFGTIAFAISDDKSRYYLHGAYLHRDAVGQLCVVATDTHQMALISSTIEPEASTLPPSGVIIPQKSVEQILKLKAEQIVFRTDSKVIEARTEAITISSKLIDGTYPDFRRIIAAEPVASAEVDRGDLLAVLERMSAANAAHSKAWRVTLKWKADDDAVQLTVADGEMAADAISATVIGEANIALAVDRLLTLVDAIHAKRLALGNVSSRDPLRILPVDDDSLLTVLAPCLE